MNHARGQLLWDIYEEHLDEAAFLFGQWTSAMDAANYFPSEVAAGPEERLLAHLDGLVVGGARVADKLLLPALQGDDLDKVFVAAWALLAAEQADHFPVLSKALLDGPPEKRDAVARAFELGVRHDLGAKTSALWERSDPAGQAAILDVMNTRDPAWTQGRVFHALASPEPRLVAAGLRAARRHPDLAFAGHADHLLRHEDPMVREEALLTSFLYGTAGVWDACRAAAATGTRGSRVPLSLLAIRGIGPTDPAFQTLLADAAQRSHALYALGFSGTVEAMDVLVSSLSQEDVARVAGESMTTITGVVIGGAFSRPGEHEGAEAEDEVRADEPPPEVLPEDNLLIPNAAALAAWWKDLKPQMTPNAPYLLGLPRNAAVLKQAARVAPTWRRRVLVVEAAAQARSGVTTDVRGWARTNP